MRVGRVHGSLGVRGLSRSICVCHFGASRKIVSNALVIFPANLVLADKLFTVLMLAAGGNERDTVVKFCQPCARCIPLYWSVLMAGGVGHLAAL